MYVPLRLNNASEQISIIHTRFYADFKVLYYLRMNDCKYVGSWQGKNYLGSLPAD